MPFNDFASRGHCCRRTLIATLVALPLAAATLQAQATVPRGEDASTVPGGLLRVRLLPTWTRAFDRWTTRDGERRLIPLGSEIASDSLGVHEIPRLGQSEALIRTLSGEGGFRINLGRSEAAASTRTVGVPIALEYGVTNRLTVGVTVPIVQTRTRFTYVLNNEATRPPGVLRFNSGANPGTHEKNALVVQQLRKLRSDLNLRLAQCTGSADPGCAIVVQEEAQVRALAEDAGRAADRVEMLFGVSAELPGQPVVPIANSATQLAIESSLDQLATRASRYLDGAPTIGSENLGSALGPAGKNLLDDLFVSRYDSVAEVSRLSIGDVEVGAKLRVLDTQRGDTLRQRGIRLAVSGLVRFGTGTVALDSPYGLGTGDGQMDVEGGAFVDANLSRRVGATVSARYTKQLGETSAHLPDELGEVDVLEPLLATARLGDRLMLEMMPRYRLTRALSLDGYYTLARTGGGTFQHVLPAASSVPSLPEVTTSTTSIQQIGVGVSYSSLEPWLRRAARLPVDLVVSYHQTIASSGGPALKTSSMQIQLRVYQQLFGRHRPAATTSGAP